MDKSDLHKKDTVMITGASSGIGAALAHIAAGQGHDLILVARSVDKLRTLAAELGKAHGVEVAVHQADLSRPGAAERLWQAVSAEDMPVDMLINNAGVLQHGAFAGMTPTEHQAMIQLNVAGMTDLLAHALPPMLARGHGRILNVASVAAFQPIPSLATYAATKAFVLSLTEALAEELRGSGVSITALCPGVTATSMMAKAQEGSEALQNLPAMLISDVQNVAQEAWRACLKGQTIVVPGTLNLAATLAGRATPKWLLRRISGLLGRSTL